MKKVAVIAIALIVAGCTALPDKPVGTDYALLQIARSIDFLAVMLLFHLFK